ncbi:hypothetical protein E1B28_001450 [Marasmius oreades]|uniref:SGNH hydrolase-type esterase domain-containing protein n=1 Tax=Marasmius oreades TaxID=181124 RepID=A0A9P7V3S0_9AGAR|nr:uncharacterized protein E1B28_001450 [Marasmius oreades]KAG7099622.1 hypothetical protein E1B28_001450 [Marasmius oreades]
MLLYNAVALLAATLAVRSQTLYLAGDSTMAPSSGVIQGWGTAVGRYLSITTVNKGVGGESARSYTNNGRFNEIINVVKPGDFVVFEFGHNDVSAGSGNPDNGKQDAVGDGYDITATVTAANGTQILIHSFAYYIENAINAVAAKGGISIISSLTPHNSFVNGNIGFDGGRFQTYAKSIGTRKNIVYVDHYSYTAQAFNALGQTKVATFFPDDALHFNAAGADVVAQAFIKGLLCSTSTLKIKVNSAGPNVPNGCL